MWTGALREGLGQPELGLLADLTMAQSVFVTRTAFWQLPGMLLIPGSENSFFYLHSGPPIIEMAGGG